MAELVPSAPRGLLETVPGLKQAGLLAGVAAAVAAAIWLVIWSQGQNYTVLYGQLSERESGQVMDALTAAGIEYKLNPSGAVSVPESKVQEARIRLASQGLPQSDSMGIEMIQKESALGSSSMMETARYQSVLETELARTIVKVQGVQTARVHLALPKPSVFLRDARKATASVMLQLYPGRRLEPGQVAAIVHLVASSVPELGASDVTLVDQAGSLLNSPDENAEQAASTRQLEFTHKLEDDYQRRIIELLEPMIGAGRVRATVTADLDFTVTEETHENYDPQKTAIRSEQTSKEQRHGGDGAEGIPGALSNQPPGTSGAPVIPGAAGTPGSPSAQTRGEQRPDFERRAQHAQLRSGSQVVVREAAGRCFEAPERRCRVGRLAEDRRRRQDDDEPHERHGHQALHSVGARVDRPAGRSRRSIERFESGLQD